MEDTFNIYFQYFTWFIKLCVILRIFTLKLLKKKILISYKKRNTIPASSVSLEKYNPSILLTKFFTSVLIPWPFVFKSMTPPPPPPPKKFKKKLESLHLMSLWYLVLKIHSKISTISANRPEVGLSQNLQPSTPLMSVCDEFINIKNYNALKHITLQIQNNLFNN